MISMFIFHSHFFPNRWKAGAAVHPDPSEARQSSQQLASQRQLGQDNSDAVAAGLLTRNVRGFLNQEHHSQVSCLSSRICHKPLSATSWWGFIWNVQNVSNVKMLLHLVALSREQKNHCSSWWILLHLSRLHTYLLLHFVAFSRESVIRDPHSTCPSMRCIHVAHHTACRVLLEKQFPNVFCQVWSLLFSTMPSRCVAAGCSTLLACPCAFGMAAKCFETFGKRTLYKWQDLSI